jgi:alpha-L-rhamnosidase
MEVCGIRVYVLVLIAVVVALVVAQSSFADVFSDAKWLRDPVFKGVPVISIAHKEKIKPPKLRGPQNVHTLYRKAVNLPAKPVSAILTVTGDDYYKLYLNGAFVVQGPEAGYPSAHPYYQLQVARFLQEGANCIASHGYYQGLLNRVWNSADNRSGFMMTLDLRYPDGREERIVTDASWRCHTPRAFPAGRTIGYKTQFAEDIDLRAIPDGWRELGFDDSAWQPPLSERQDHEFIEQITPPLEYRRVEPATAKRVAKGHYLYDFGGEIVGHTRIRVEGEEGHVLEVQHGEELSGPDAVRYKMRANCEYQEFPVLKAGENLVEFYDYRAFRYLAVLNAPSEPEVWADVRHHPFDVDATAFDASDELLVRIWELCKRGVQYGSQGGFLDCPSREKGQYLGDALITGRSHLILTADPSLTHKSLVDFQQSQTISPGIMAVAPGSFMQEIAEYSLQWPLLLAHYFRLTGDRETTEALADAAFPPLFEYFAHYENKHGLLTGIDEKWVLVDWPENLRDDYDYEYAKTRENAVLNAFYYQSLKTAGQLLEVLDRDGQAYLDKAERAGASFRKRMLDPETGLFLDAPGSSHSSLHANAVPLAFGLVAPENIPQVVELIRKKRLNCGVYIASFVIEACFQAGEPELAYDLITSKDEHSWHEMLKHGATTCMEAWGPDQKWNTSWCHPWSSSPIYLIAEHVMGLSPAAPGWSSIRFAPNVPKDLEHATITLPIPQGRVTVRYRRGEGFEVLVPPGIPVYADLPEEVPVRVSGEARQARADLNEAQRAFLESNEWAERVGSAHGVWVSVDEQRLRIVEDGQIIWDAPCATAALGTGSRLGSNQTPLGWHRIARKTGDGAAPGQVFRSGIPTSEVWRPGDDTSEDLVLTRILFLDGLEPGRNKGGEVDSTARYIYIHGTNDEERLGTPSSHGCVRLSNRDVVEAYDLVPIGTLLVITEEGQPG